MQNYSMINSVDLYEKISIYALHCHDVLSINFGNRERQKEKPQSFLYLTMVPTTTISSILIKNIPKYLCSSYNI